MARWPQRRGCQLLLAKVGMTIGRIGIFYYKVEWKQSVFKVWKGPLCPICKHTRALWASRGWHLLDPLSWPGTSVRCLRGWLEVASVRTQISWTGCVPRYWIVPTSPRTNESNRGSHLLLCIYKNTSKEFTWIKLHGKMEMGKMRKKINEWTKYK